MKIFICDANYRNNEYKGLAYSWLFWEAQRANVKIVSPNEADIILMTVASPQGVEDVRREVKRLRKGGCRAPIFLGGGGCYAPAIFEDYVDAVFVGEGQKIIRTLFTQGINAALQLDNVWIKNDTRQVIPSTAFPWDVPPLLDPDGTVRVFGARGCRYKCLFCQTGWAMPYQPCPNTARLQHQLDSLYGQGRKCAVVVNDAAEESLTFKGPQQFVSARYSNLLKMMPFDNSFTRTVRIGVEGVSERLRVAVGKPVDNDGLLNLTAYCCEKKINVRWFFVVGLPGETEKDYEEFKELIKGVQKIKRGPVIVASLHSFYPQPATPLGVLPLEETYYERVSEIREWFFKGLGYSKRLSIVRPAGYEGRRLRSCQAMACADEDLMRGWFENHNRNWRVKYLLPPERLRIAAQAYARKVGIKSCAP